jgi:hypothetical protein
MSLVGETGRHEFIQNIGSNLDKYSNINSRRKWQELLSDIGS